MNCKKHPKYKAIRKPRTSCLTCWIAWLKKHPGEEILAKDFECILGELSSAIYSFSHSMWGLQDFVNVAYDWTDEKYGREIEEEERELNE